MTANQRQGRQRLARMMALAVGMGGLAPAFGTVTSVQVTPTQANVVFNRSARLELRWQVRTDSGPYVQSDQGSVEDGAGNVYLVVPRPLSAPGAGGQTLQLTETLAIPAAVLLRAFDNGVRRLYYRRDFRDGSGTAGALGGTAVLDLSGAGAAGFAIDSLRLAFADDTVRRQVAVGEPLRARATLRFSGSGQLQAVWELADPASASGSPVFRTLRIVRRPLFGGGAASLDSPPLPTRLAGLYLLRLRVLQPAVTDTPIVLQYYVHAATDSRLAPIDILTPAPGEPLAAGDSVRWRPVAGAARYRLEFQAAGAERSRRPRAGMEVDGRRARLRLSALLVPHLDPGSRYRWRLVAVAADGRRIAASAWRAWETSGIQGLP